MAVEKVRPATPPGDGADAGQATRYGNGSTLRRAGRQLLIAPTALWIGVFFIAPLGLMLVYSFGQMDPVLFRVEFGWTLSSYSSIFQGITLHTLERSLLMSLGATLACLVIGYPVALAISRQPKHRQYVLILAVMLPFWTSFVVRTYAWLDLLSTQGPIADLTNALGLGRPQIAFTPLSVAIGIAYNYLPLMVLPLYVTLERIDPRLLDAASDLGASSWRTLRRVIFPLSLPGVVAGCMLVAIPALGEYVVPAIMGGGKTLMYGNLVGNQFLDTGNYPFGSALAISLMIGLGACIVVGRLALSKTTRRTEAAA